MQVNRGMFLMQPTRAASISIPPVKLFGNQSFKWFSGRKCPFRRLPWLYQLSLPPTSGIIVFAFSPRDELLRISRSVHRRKNSFCSTHCFLECCFEIKRVWMFFFGCAPGFRHHDVIVWNCRNSRLVMSWRSITTISRWVPVVAGSRVTWNSIFYIFEFSFRVFCWQRYSICIRMRISLDLECLCGIWAITIMATHFF